jgi:parallel beta-helix repeat protein
MDIIYVDDDNHSGPWDGSSIYPFASIQEGIDHASTDEWVFVNSGIYQETIIIENSIRLLGEEKTTTIIDGGRADDVITIHADDVLVSGFTVRNSQHDLENGFWWKAGIRILGSNATIIDNIITDNLQGIFLKQAENLTLLNNEFFHDGLTIYPYDTGYTTRPELKRSYYTHLIDNNTVNGRPLVYLVDEDNLEISSPVGQLICVNCSSCRIHNITLTDTDFPIIFYRSKQCIIESVDCFDNDGICSFLNSDSNIIRKSLFHQNMHGFLLDYHSKENRFSQNTFSENIYCGLICEYHSNDNIITENTFIDNQGFDAFVIKAFSNKWKNNYWSDWVGINHPLFRWVPKLIFGTHFESYQRIKTYVNVDWTPSHTSYQGL